MVEKKYIKGKLIERRITTYLTIIRTKKKDKAGNNRYEETNQLHENKSKGLNKNNILQENNQEILHDRNTTWEIRECSYKAPLQSRKIISNNERNN